MPVLLQILQAPAQKELRSLKGKTLECLSLIIFAVGKTVFAPDAAGFIQVLQNIQATVTDADDPQSSYLLSAWARICTVLGTDFAPYLPIVLPPLIASASLKPEMVAFDASEDTGDRFNEEDGWEVMAVGEKVLNYFIIRAWPSKPLFSKINALRLKCWCVMPRKWAQFSMFMLKVS